MTALATLVLWLLLSPAAAAAGAAPVPAGYEVTESESLGEGVEHLALRSDEQSVHVAVVERGAPYEFRTLVAGDQVGSPLERPSAMCRRAGCLVAVNGDFTLPGTTVPVGGVVSDGVLLRSPSAQHHQLSVAADGSLAAGPVTMSGRLVTSALDTVTIDGVNVERVEQQTVLYTSLGGPSTGTNRFGVELVVRFVDSPDLHLGQTSVVELVDLLRGGNASVPSDGAVISAHGEAGESLARAWEAVAGPDGSRRALLRVESDPEAVQSVGGTPLLLRDGQVWAPDEDANFVAGRHPRTVVGWNRHDGRTFVVTVDGRQPGHARGMSLREAAELLLDLGATDALNLDGGGSTTFVIAGEVRNRPSDRLIDSPNGERIVPVPRNGDDVVGSVERPRTTALALVPVSDAAAPIAPLDADALDLPEPLDLPVPTDDPASVPGAHLPALVDPAPSSPREPLAAVATVSLAAMSAALGWARRRRAGAAASP